ncbi:MAG: hypothetical protein Q9164_002395 [Protoblastenia rupestris]
MTRPVNKDYYYIDFHATIDAIKYRMFYLTEKVKELYKPSHEKKDYFCPQCHSQWTQLEVLDKFGPMGFECHRCGGPLEREERQEGDSTGHEKQSKLMSQLDGFIKMLQHIDNQDIPNNDFETALSLAVPVQRDATVNPLRPFQPVDKIQTSTVVKGVTQVTAVPLDVSVTTSSDRTAAVQAEEAQRKADLAAQNVLPVWHTTSTVTGEKTVYSSESETQMNGNTLVKGEEEEKKDANVMNDELTAYYAQMLQEKEKEAREDREADESSGDDDDEFEDVEVGRSVVGNVSNTISTGINGKETSEADNGGKPSGSESSVPATNASTPASGVTNGQVDTEGPASKKVKFEDVANGALLSETNGNAAAVEKDSDEDDGVEFEDV